ncbi:MAG TPA: SHOCT domain-containing protein [Acidimicrobiales bacterium]|jgi:hypothetical protein|nr:SHOCT domain-containing protein [Acidimicrobiales bacterium]
MIFLLRPPQTYMPYWLPRDPPSRAGWDDQLQKAYSSTRRVAPARPNPNPDPGAAASPRDLVAALKDLGALRESGALSDEEFETAKAKLLSGTAPG